MKATAWEFKNRGLIFGLILGWSFFLYRVDPRNSADVLAGWLGGRSGMNRDLLLHLIFAFAAASLVFAAAIRTWASAHLNAGVVYASHVKSDSLVADGPYRFVRNPLYLANVLMALAMGFMMSRTGFINVVVLIWVFCYRLILREESELGANRGEAYERYRDNVRRLWPSLVPQVAAAGREANWRSGLKAETWFWGFAIALTALAITLNLIVYFVIFGASIALAWLSSWLLQRSRPRLDEDT